MQRQQLARFDAQIQARLGAAGAAQVRQYVQGEGPTLDAGLNAAGPPREVCSSFIAELAEETFDVRGRAPNLSRLLGEAGAASPATAPAAQKAGAPASGASDVGRFLVPAGQGLKDSEILGVYITLSYTSGVGGMVLPDYPASLFLRDGTVYRDPYWAPDSFNVRLSRQQEPGKWGRWTRQGQNFVIRWGSGETETFKVEKALAPLAPGTTLGGEYETLSGGGNTALGGDVAVVAGKTYTFGRDGTFSSERFGGGGTSSVTALSTGGASGTYRISGYGITLTAGGQQQRLFFARYNDDMIYIGSAIYLSK